VSHLDFAVGFGAVPYTRYLDDTLWREFDVLGADSAVGIDLDFLGAVRNQNLLRHSLFVVLGQAARRGVFQRSLPHLTERVELGFLTAV